MIRMRDKNQNYIQFSLSVEKYVSRNLTVSSFLRPPVVITPTVPDDFKIIYPKKFHQVEQLVLIHWFLPDSLKYRIHLDLRDQSFSNFNRKQQIQLRVMLESKEVCLAWFLETEELNSNEFWGILGLACRITLDGYSEDKIIKRPQRKRGYDDKGGMKSEDKWLPKHDFSFTQTQNEIEKKRYLLQKTIDFILRYLSRVT